MISSSMFSLFATQVLGSIGRGFRQHGRLVAEYPWPIIVFRFWIAVKLPFFWTQTRSLTILSRKFPIFIGITVSSSHYCCLCSSPCLSLLVIIPRLLQRFVCNRLLWRDLTRVERGDRYVDTVAATGFHFCNQSSAQLILLWLTHFLFLRGRYSSKSFLFSGFWVCSKHSVA